GELRRMVRQGLAGMTSNPTIFEKAIAGSADYDDAVRAGVERGADDTRIFLDLAFEDIREAAEILHPVYDLAEGADGFVSMELPPDLAYDTAGSIETARRFAREIGAPNV